MQFVEGKAVQPDLRQILPLKDVNGKLKVFVGLITTTACSSLIELWCTASSPKSNQTCKYFGESQLFYKQLEKGCWFLKTCKPFRGWYGETGFYFLFQSQGYYIILIYNVMCKWIYKMLNKTMLNVAIWSRFEIKLTV